jgi:hypothetical protein
VILADLQSPGQALLAYVAAPTNLLRLLDLEDGGASVADGEEQLWVFFKTRRAVAPIHGGELLLRHRWPADDGDRLSVTSQSDVKTG